MDNRTTKLTRVTLVGSLVNMLLTIAKLFAGFLGQSAAMVADGIHSLSDLISDVIVLVFVRIAAKDKDRNHEYGHGKFETLASLIISIMLLVVAVKLLISGIGQTFCVLGNKPVKTPGWIALAAAAVSIVSKEILYRYTIKAAKEENSSALSANAWHHRTDSLSSIAAFIGIAAAMILGGKWIILDPLVCCGISIFIIVIAVKMFFPGISELMETSLPETTEKEIIETISSIDGITNVHELKTRHNGKSIIIDSHIVVDPDLTVRKAHEISTMAEDALRKRFGEDTVIFIHIEPDLDSL